MKVSVITINRNNAEGLERSIRSLEAQSAACEYIVVDGGSTDHSMDIVRQSKAVTRFLSEKDNGIYHAMNKGLSMASGDYVYFLNSGDEFYSSKVLSAVSALAGPGIIYGNIILKNAVRQKLVPPGKLDVPFFMTGTLWHPCAFVKRELFDSAGPFNESMRIAADYEFFIRAVLRHNADYRYADIDISLYDMSGISNRPENSALESEERRMSWELNFSLPVIEAFEDYTRLLRSGEYKWGKRLKSLMFWTS
jgi:glycosyltransferase involved in cell wall biosynthesis